MDKTVLFAIEDIEKYVYDDDPELAIAHVRFLSTAPNSHKINITEEILRRDASSILGKFLVAKMNWMDNDTEGHAGNKQHIMGYFPAEQEVQFTETEEGYIVASADAVISKLYANSYYNIFVNDNKRNVSVEMLTKNPEELEDGTTNIDGIHICAVTSLGKQIKGSCPDANIVMTRFSEDEATEFYNKQNHSVNKLQKFASERRAKMAEKISYKINKTELKDIDWGKVDKADLRDKVMEAKNRATLVKAVYALIEEGWEDAPSEHLKYPLMAEIDGTFYYVREALSSALAYAKQHNEQDVIDKVEGLYKKFNLEDSEGKEEKEEMSDVEKFSAVEIGDLWGKLWDALHVKYPDGEYNNIYVIDSIWEEDNKKFALIRRRDEDNLYRLDFSLTEEGLELAEEIIKIEIEMVETDEVRKFAEPEDVEKYKAFAEPEPDYKQMFEDEQAKSEELQAKIDEQCNIIMAKDEQIKELQAFKDGIENQQKMCVVSETLAKIKGKIDETSYAEFAESGEKCELSQIDAWKNGIYAKLGEIMLSNDNDNEGESTFMKFELPNAQKQFESAWDRLN